VHIYRQVFLCSSKKQFAGFVSELKLFLFLVLLKLKLLPFLVLLTLKLKLIFLKSRSSTHFLVSLTLKLKLIFLKSKSGFLFRRCSHLLHLPDATAEIEKTAGVCGSTKAYFFKSNLVSFPGIVLAVQNRASFFQR